jgi:thiol-disulfide isomerase/thioredoxin
LEKIKSLKKYLLLLLVAFVTKASFAQHNPDSATFLRFPIVPPFKIIKIADSTAFTKDDLKKKTVTIVMVFSPDCEHCQAETKELTANIDKFKKVQIVMASPLEFDFIKKFYEEFDIAKYSNITMGRDPSYFLGTFYDIHAFPAIYVYNKKGKLVNWHSGSTPIAKLLEDIKM